MRPRLRTRAVHAAADRVRAGDTCQAPAAGRAEEEVSGEEGAGAKEALTQGLSAIAGGARLERRRLPADIAGVTGVRCRSGTSGAGVMKRAWAAAIALFAGEAHAGDYVFFDSFEGVLHPVAGAVIVTEIMSNPSVASDSAGEWFELANVSAQTVDLGGCFVGRDAVQDALPTHPLLPGEFAVVARSTDMVSNGNVTAFSTFSFSLLSSGTIDLSCDDRLIDEVQWASETQGRSRNLDPQSFNATDNDNAGNWCLSTQTYNDVDTGTPDSGNEPCS
jgi:hypothetical protein